MAHNPIEIEIQWRCSHCGHRYQQPLAVCIPGAANAEQPKLVSSGSLICTHCGQLGPMQIGCALVLGLSVMAGSDGAVHSFRAPAVEEGIQDWARGASQPSRN